MKIDFSVVLKGLDGVELKPRDMDSKSLTLRDVCVDALLVEKPGDKVDSKEKLRRYRLAEKIYGCKEPISLSVEDIVIIKEQTAFRWSTLVMGRAWDLLEGEGGQA